MSDTAAVLHTTVDTQIAELIDALGAADSAILGRPCGGRQKLGDGSVAAVAAHTADNYLRIAEFALGSGPAPSASPAHVGHTAHGRAGWFMRLVGHRPPAHGPGAMDHGAGGAGHGTGYTAATVDRDQLLTAFSEARAEFAPLAEIPEQRLQAIPLKDSFRFCDGKRSLAEVLEALFKHQRHQVDSLVAAVPGS